jgi:hypothetical protein
MEASKALDTLKPRKILLPIIIGLSVAGFLVYKDFDLNAFLSVNWTWHAGIWCLMAFVMMVTRDLAYMYRIRVLTDNELSWRRSFDVIFLWEFASAITPTIVGGSAVAIFIIYREIKNVGKSTAIVMVSALLDELFYITMVPLLYFSAGGDRILAVAGGDSVEQITAGYGLFYVFIFGYIFILSYTIIILYALFVNPRVIKWVFIKICAIPFLRKWRNAAAIAGDDLIVAAKEIKGKKKRFWVKAGGATLVSWTARFWVVNFLVLIPLEKGIPFIEHILIYARQLIMWVIMLISPTPGSSGLAEIVFSVFLEDFIPEGLTSSTALLWRLISYYPYLFIGALILPGWLKRVYRKE